MFFFKTTNISLVLLFRRRHTPVQKFSYQIQILYLSEPEQFQFKRNVYHHQSLFHHRLLRDNTRAASTAKRRTARPLSLSTAMDKDDNPHTQIGSGDGPSLGHHTTTPDAHKPLSGVPPPSSAGRNAEPRTKIGIDHRRVDGRARDERQRRNGVEATPAEARGVH